MINDSGIIPGDVDGFTDFVRSIDGVEVAIMVCENELEKCRINFRSKGRYVINNIANNISKKAYEIMPITKNLKNFFK